MESYKLKEGIYWVGGIDWDLRDFHGYKTGRGSSYNSYLILDEKTVLVDTVKHYLFEEMIERVRGIIDPSKIDYIISNHVEMDHSGSIPFIKELAPEAEVITSTRGEKGLRKHYGEGLKLRVVKTGDSLKIGKKTLSFVETPMVHWPDNMVTYLAEDKILFSNDAFGQHIASNERFDDEVGWDIAREEAAKYYANIVLPYGKQVRKALDALSGLEPDMIAPSHGLIWRSYISRIIDEYVKWSGDVTEKKALIVYDTMWGSTEKIAYALSEGIESVGMGIKMRNLKVSHISDVMTDLLDSRLVLVGSPTLNNGMLPALGGFLTYLKGLRPSGRTALAFGSYGWGGQAAGEIEEILKKLGWSMPFEKININYIPTEENLDEIKKTGSKLAREVLADRKSDETPIERGGKDG